MLKIVVLARVGAGARKMGGNRKLWEDSVLRSFQAPLHARSSSKKPTLGTVQDSSQLCVRKNSHVVLPQQNVPDSRPRDLG